MNEKKLFKSAIDKKLCGVCGGLAEYLGIDSTLVRVAWAIFACCGGAGIVAYILCALIMPEQTQI